MKKRYLVAHWCEGKGTTKENPAYYCGPYGYIVTDLNDVKFDRCYRTEHAALKEVEKLCGRYWWACPVEIKI